MVCQLLASSGNLDRRLGRPPDPVQRHAVEGAAAPEVDVHPLLAGAGAHPRAGEMVRAAGLHALAFIAQHHLADRPAGDAGAGKFDANPAAGAQARRKRTAKTGGAPARARPNPHAKPAGGRSALAVRPSSVHACPSSEPLTTICHPAGWRASATRAQSGQLHAVDFERSVAAQQIDLDPRARAVQRHGGDVVAVERMLAVLFFEHARRWWKPKPTAAGACRGCRP